MKYLNLAITKSIVNIFAEILHAVTCRGAIDMKHNQTELKFEHLGPIPYGGLKGGAETEIKL